MYYFDVLFPQSINQAFTYSYASVEEKNYIGFRVLVPFAKQLKVGIIIGQKDAKAPIDPSLKAIEKLIDQSAFITENLIQLIDFMSSYYMAKKGDILRFLLPNGTIPRVRKTLYLKEQISFDRLKQLVGRSSVKYEILQRLKKEERISYAKLEKSIGKTIYSQSNELVKQNIICIDYELLSAKINEKKVDYILPHVDFEAAKSLRKNAYKQFEVLSFLEKQNEAVRKTELIRDFNLSRLAIDSLLDKKIIRKRSEVKERKFIDSYDSETHNHPFTPEQEHVFDQLIKSKNQFSTFLLHGITGSGKTLIYIRMLSEVIKSGKTAIILIPEIALTAQTVARFRSHFGDLINILNSRMTDGERYDAWRLIRDRKYKIVIGPRSAIFAPLENIGLIVVDEEHEWSYKQSDQTPRYNARDLAIYRAKVESCPIILGSATPSLESYFNTKSGKYDLVTLKNRPLGATLPHIEIIDLKEELRLFPSKENVILSIQLENAIEQRLLKKEQIILFQNKRGYSSYLSCKDCGSVQECPSCSISLVYHKHGNVLKCHYCAYETKPYRNCQKCKSPNLDFAGYGTQRVEEYLAERFPNIRTLRMDFDTTKGRNGHQKILRRFSQGEADVLVGTQMIAKGLDFPNVTLVAVLNADSSLNIPDFRSAERSFQLLSQVAGRAGRAKKKGQVIIQAFQPEHYAIQETVAHNFESFYEKEIDYRKKSAYPPFSRLINIKFIDADKTKLFHASRSFRKKLEHFNSDSIQILGPSACVIEKLDKNFRWQILIKLSKENSSVVPLKFHLNEIQESVKKEFSIKRLICDVDPYDLI